MQRQSFLASLAAFFFGSEEEALAMNVSISVPGDGSALKGTIPVTVEARPLRNLQRVALYVDGVLLGSDTTDPFLFSWDTTQGPDGKHILSAKAFYKQRISEASLTVWTANTVVPPPPPPPSTGKLRWAPPGYSGSGDPRDPANYPGYTVLGPVTTPGFLNLDDAKDYFIRLGTISASSNPTGSRTYMLGINGGRNVVVIGGAINFNITNALDDAVGIQVDDGDPNGIVHLEGINVVCANGITVRTQREIRAQNMRIHVDTYQGNFQNIHPDMIQVWDRGPSQAVRLHKFTAYGSMTTFSIINNGSDGFTDCTPLDWEMYDVDLHGVPPYGGGKPLIGANVWMGNPARANWHGSNLWWETPWETASSRGDLGDVARQYGTQFPAAAFEIYDANNVLVYTSPLNPTNGSGSGLNPIGGRQGDYIRYSRVPLLSGLRWNALKATVADGADSNGNFVSSTLAGTGYVSPGYR